MDPYPCHSMYVLYVTKNVFKNYLFYFDYPEKAHRTYEHILKGGDVGMLLSNVVEETRVRRGNHQRWTGDHYATTYRHRELIPIHSDDKRGFNHALSRPYYVTHR